VDRFTLFYQNGNSKFAYQCLHKLSHETISDSTDIFLDIVSGSRKEIEQETKSMNLAQRNEYLLKRVLDHIKSNPVSYVIRSFNNLIYLHSRETIGIHWNEKGLVSRYGSTVLFPLKIISQVYWLCALGLALARVGCAEERSASSDGITIHDALRQLSASYGLKFNCRHNHEMIRQIGLNNV